MKKFVLCIVAAVALQAQAQLTTNNGVPYLEDQAVDMSQQFMDPTNTLFCADSLVS